MATATAQVALVPTCDGCQCEDSRWFCDDCQINLCDRCKGAHQRGPKTKNDNIIPVGQVQQGAQGKIVPVLCESHKTKLCELYCYTCEKLICPKCLSKEHKTHSFNNIESLVDSKVTELQSIKENLKSKVSSYDTVLASEGKEHADYMMHIDHLEVKVKGQTEKIVKEFYKLRDKQLSELLALKKEEDKRYMVQCNERQSCLTDINKTIESVEKAEVSGNATIMIQVVKESSQFYQSLEDPTASNLSRPEFQCDENPEAPLFLQLQGRLKLSTMKVKKKQPPKVVPIVPNSLTDARVVLPKHVIDMNNVKVKLKIKISGKAGLVRAVIPTDNNMAWIAVVPDKHLSLVDTEGRVVKKSVEVDDEIYFAVPYDGDILAVHAKSHCVMRYSKDGDSVTTFSDLSPFYTNGLCVTNQQDVMVSLKSSLTFDSTLTSKVVRLDHHGHVIQEIHYRNRKPLFTFAVSVTSLPEGDVLVKDYEGNDVYKTICVDKTGNYRYTWSGEVGGRKVNNFSPCDMTHDDQNVYITDYNNHCVYVLDRHGKAEQLMLDKLGITYPAAISIDNRGRMWIGCKGIIHVLK